MQTGPQPCHPDSSRHQPTASHHAVNTLAGRTEELTEMLLLMTSWACSGSSAMVGGLGYLVPANQPSTTVILQAAATRS